MMNYEKKEERMIILPIIGVIIIIIIFAICLTSFMFNKYDEINEKKNEEANHIQEVFDVNNIKKPDVSVNNVNDFSISFLKMENKKQNMLYSPLSIKYALKMLSEGANGNTKTQIDNVIGNESITKYENIEDVLSLANAAYIRDTYSNYIKESFKNTLIERYNAEVIYDSFENANNINNWIENKTLHIIKNMLKDEQVQKDDLVMFLINALAIDMEWEDKFDMAKTSEAPFYVNGKEMIEATTMHKKTSSDNFAFYKNEDLLALTMDLKKYNDTQLEFMVIMPTMNLDEYIQKFTMEELNNITNKLTAASDTKGGVNISIPKFNFNYDLELKQDLMTLGITDAFNKDVADFSNISNESLNVGNALHKADIEFTEEGVKAAAVTVFTVELSSAFVEENQPEEINIDNPFLFVIRDKNTNEIWFVGTVYKPNLWENDKDDYQRRF